MELELRLRVGVVDGLFDEAELKGSLFVLSIDVRIGEEVAVPFPEVLNLIINDQLNVKVLDLVV